ncbi:RIP metalloprotease RseP [Cohnella sp. CIP 111063]|uniref:RIP metalloprotease RseP n=1 Tax=unclassified Cohnella TaxID=2636738 RepID=UPI000B8C270D|nr:MULTISPECIES: RIP metalloprotease RseP [unclassified Cohnella]OXS59712.1 RIP metalloprotease RseP [Cohnella sp. CIP 111063]PRX72502.1 regulator of sigma E protease [Cohnella sp. SGD-V74]
MGNLQVALLTILMFFLLVSLHEWGHYYFARRAGILVREFAIGFGPKLFSVKKGETRYTLRLLPIGGFVRMAGEDPEIVEVQPGQTVALRVKDDKVTRIYLDRLDERSDVMRGEVKSLDLEKGLFVTLDIDGDIERYSVHPQAQIIAKGRETQIAPIDRQFGHKTVGQRALSIFAGPVMNFVLAFVLFALYLVMQGVPLENSSKVFISRVVEDAPAEQSGIEKGDWVKSINGEPIGGDLNAMVEKISASAGKPLQIVVDRDGVELPIKVTPDSETGKIGIYPIGEMRAPGALETIRFSGETMVEMTKRIFEGFQKLIRDFNLDDVGGPVKTTQVTVEIAQQGVAQLTLWAGILSLYLGIFNLLPIPALDGSRLLFLGLEAVRGKPVDPNRESMVHLVGFAMLMLLMIVVTYNDIVGLVRN